MEVTVSVPSNYSAPKIMIVGIDTVQSKEKAKLYVKDAS